MLDGGAWVELSSGGGATNPLTGAQIKALYEAEADTNALTDALKTIIEHITVTKDLDLDVISNNAKAALNQLTNLSLDPSGPTVMTIKEIELDKAQVVSPNPAVAIVDNRLMSVASVFSMMHALKTKTMMEKGNITAINDVRETGIFEGTDVTGAPVPGKIMVMSNKDINGDYGYFLMGHDGVLHTGGRPAGGKVFWTEIKSVTPITGEFDVQTDYSGGFMCVLLDTFSGTATTDIYDGKEHVVSFALKAGDDWASTTDPVAWYLRQSTGELGHFTGASGHIGKDTMKSWVMNRNKVTIKYTDTTKKDFLVSKVEGDNHIQNSNPILSVGSVKVEKFLVVGDRSGEAQLTLDAKAGTASQIVFKRGGIPVARAGLLHAVDDQLVIQQTMPAHIEFVLPAGQIIRAKIGTKFHTLAMLDDLERPTVVSAYTATPLKTELIAAAKLLPHYSNDAEFWGGGHDFYVRDNPQTKMLLVKYRGVTAAVSEATAGNFFF